MQGEAGEWGARSGPPTYPDDLGRPRRRAGAGPEAALTRGGDVRGPCPAGSGVRVKESGLRDQLPGPFAGSGGRRGAVRGAENSPRRREGMEERAALRRARTSGQAGQEQAGTPGTLSPKAPRSLTLPGAE